MRVIQSESHAIEAQMPIVQLRERRALEIYSWCPEIEAKALAQAYALAYHPKAFHHIGLMPDTHPGMGIPIGGVIACLGALIPNAVGVDIGCGMSAARYDLRLEGFPEASNLTKSMIRDILALIRADVPMGFNHHEKAQDWHGFEEAPAVRVVSEQLESARRQLMTLGGGNHFIELQADEEGFLWAMVHSGSRNFGLQIAKVYNQKAQALCEQWSSDIGVAKGEEGLAFLPIGTVEAEEYIDAIRFALRFASENRRRILETCGWAIEEITGATVQAELESVHNFAQLEQHFGKAVWIHRKGATPAKAGHLAIIPGSMGTASYIVEGLGNPLSFESCSHGAGRSGGRKEFNRTHTLEECQDSMADVVFDGWEEQRQQGKPLDLSEAPAAYKNIAEVMANQQDLVKIVHSLRPLGVLKG